LQSSLLVVELENCGK